MGNKLDEVLEEKTNSVASEIQTDASGQNKSGRPKLRLYLLSELELGTKLSDPEVLANVGELIKNDTKHIDGVVINGLMAYVPDRYSRWRGERLDLMEDHLLERYGQTIYDQVKRGKNESNSVDDLVEATRLGRIMMSPIVQQAKKKNIDIHCIAGNTDYRNVRMLIESLEKLNKRNIYNENNKNNSKKRGKNLNTSTDEVERVLSFIPDGYKFKASKWKSSDKDGIKNKANEIYHNIIENIFRNQNVHVYKRFENYAGEDTGVKPEEITINGLKVKVFNSINGLTVGLNEGKPSDRILKMAIEYANMDAMRGRLGDVYLTGNGSATEFTAVNYQSREDPVFMFNQGPLLDIDKQLRLRASFNKTSVAKRLSQIQDSGVSILTINEDGSLEIEHLDITALRKKINPSKLEKTLSKGSMYEMTQISDWHVGNAKGDYEAMEKVPDIMTGSIVPRNYRSLFDGGDMLDGGNDKAQRTDMSLPITPTPEEINSELEKLKDEKDYVTRIEKFKGIMSKALYGYSDIDLGRQMDRLGTYLKPIAKQVSKVYAVEGNHVKKATGNGSESRLKKSLYLDNGVEEVILPDELEDVEQNPMLGSYSMLMYHSPGYRGGIDARTALMYIARDTGQDNVDVIMAGDCHEPGINYGLKWHGFGGDYVNGEDKKGEWRTRMAMTISSLEKRTKFEKSIIHNIDYTKGISQLYLPTDDSIGTSYSRYKFIPAQTIHGEINAAGGSRLHRALDSILYK